MHPEMSRRNIRKQSSAHVQASPRLRDKREEVCQCICEVSPFSVASLVCLRFAQCGVYCTAALDPFSFRSALGAFRLFPKLHSSAKFFVSCGTVVRFDVHMALADALELVAVTA